MVNDELINNQKEPTINDTGIDLDSIRSNKGSTLIEEQIEIRKEINEALSDKPKSYLKTLMEQEDQEVIKVSDVTDLVSPTDDYERSYQNFKDNLDEYFDNITKKSGIDLVEHEKTVKDRNNAEINYHIYKNKATSKKVGKGFAIAFAVFFYLFFVGGTYNLATTKMLTDTIGLNIGIPIVIAAALVATGLVLLTVLLINKQIKRFREGASDQHTLMEVKEKEASAQVLPLFKLFRTNQEIDLINKACPFMRLSRSVSAEKFRYLQDKFNLKLYKKNQSYTNIMHGVIMNNPFMLVNYEEMIMGTKTYTGSMVISWTTYRNNQAIHHSETLIAELVKPYPYYFFDGFLVYTNDAAEKLNFSRTPSSYDAYKKNPKAKSKYLANVVKSVDKIEKDAVKSNSSYTPLTNKEFEGVFGAFDRTDETGFRVLFTPLAQKQMFEVFDKFGDDYYISKFGKASYVRADSIDFFNQKYLLDDFYNYQYNVIKENFYNYMDSAFKTLWHMLSPILAIPEFQMNENFDPKDYPDTIQNFPVLIHEMSAFAFGKANDILDPIKASECDLINETKLIDSDDDFDIYEVEFRSYKATKMLDYVQKMGGDGRLHSVPVEWYKYDEVQEVRKLAVTYIDDLNSDEIDNISELAESLNCTYEPAVYGNYLVFEYNDIINIDKLDLKKFLKRKENIDND